MLLTSLNRPRAPRLICVPRKKNKKTTSSSGLSKTIEKCHQRLSLDSPLARWSAFLARSARIPSINSYASPATQASRTSKISSSKRSSFNGVTRSSSSLSRCLKTSLRRPRMPLAIFKCSRTAIWLSAASLDFKRQNQRRQSR